MRRRLAAGLLVLAALAACSSKGGGLGPSTSPSPESLTPSVAASATVSATPSKSVSPAPSTTPSGAAYGAPVNASGSDLKRENSSEVLTISAGSSCEALYPDLLDVSCDEVRLDGGSLLYVAGTMQPSGGGPRQWVLRLHTFDEKAGGYLLRYSATDDSSSWLGFSVRPAKLLGFGVDSLVVITRLQGTPEYRSYDVLTWRKGGPLVLRAHRGALRLGRLTLSGTTIEEFEAVAASGEAPGSPSHWWHRRLQWDGRQFLGAQLGQVAAKDAPPS